MILGGIIEWSTTIGVRGWLLFMMSAILSGLLGLMAHKFFLSLTHKAISEQLCEYNLTQKSAASLFLPIALSVIVFGTLLILFDVIGTFLGRVYNFYGNALLPNITVIQKIPSVHRCFIPRKVFRVQFLDWEGSYRHRKHISN